MEKNSFDPVFLRKRPKRDIFEKTATERKLWVCGIDEAGRGPSAGPVVAAAAIVNLKRGGRSLLQDSKTLTSDERQKAYNWLKKHSWFGVGIVNPRCIDQIGIYQANILAMHRAFAQLSALHSVRASIILVDAVRLELPVPHGAFQHENTVQEEENDDSLFDNPWNKIIYFTHSEKYSYSIAAASIIAKVTRDNIMKEAQLSFPSYELAMHKGYHTPRHRELIGLHGPSIIHRQSFLRTENTPTEEEHTLSIFQV
jgi:ribonuclease HII